MTKKEEMPRKNKEEREKKPKDMSYNPDITPEDKEVLNNQSKDEKKGEYFKDREQPIDYTGSDLDIPQLDDKQFNETRNKADETEKNRKPKESANSNDNIESQTKTVYKGEKAEKYEDPSKKGSQKKD
jgi:hypothetical protein